MGKEPKSSSGRCLQRALLLGKILARLSIRSTMFEGKSVVKIPTSVELPTSFCAQSTHTQIFAYYLQISCIPLILVLDFLQCALPLTPTQPGLQDRKSILIILGEEMVTFLGVMSATECTLDSRAMESPTNPCPKLLIPKFTFICKIGVISAAHCFLGPII
jgi:hypothetical protein